MSGRFRPNEEREHREDEGILTPEEETELNAIEQETDAAEATYLRPAAERQQARIEESEARNAVLEALVPV